MNDLVNINDYNSIDDTRDGYFLCQRINDNFDYYNMHDDYPYIYEIYSPDYELIYTWESTLDVESMKYSDYLKSNIRKMFIKYVNIDRAEKEEFEDPAPAYSKYTSFNSDIFSKYKPEPEKINQEIFNKYNKSDTLCLHKSDPTTTMLSQIYANKNWDVINDCYGVNHATLHALIDSHKRIVMLGHGTAEGLIGFIRGCCAEHLKGKNIFAIWCNADKYFEKYLPEMRGKFITKNAPSEVWECRAAGCGNISEELMLENITYWCKLCADVVDDCLDGQVDKSVEYIRKNYLEKYGNHPVTIFNADSAHKFGSNVPLPKYEFKGEKLQPKDFPYPGFDEEEFLKHPVAHI